MNKLSKLACFALLLFQLLSTAACTAVDESNEVKTLTLTINDQGFRSDNTRAITPIYSFRTNDRLSLYVVNKNTLDCYANQSKAINYAGTYTGNFWNQEAQIELVDIPGTVLAFFPYDAANINPAAIPVKAQQTDYLYGSSTGTVSLSNPNAAIQMKHIHTLVRFKFLSNSSQSISEVKVSRMPESGTFNLATGVLTVSAATIESTESGLSLTVPTDKNFDYQTYILPGSQIRFNFIINGKLYFYKPATQLQIGKSYNISLTI